jgi:hypothetical protein
MKYPTVVQARIDILNIYLEDQSLELFHIIHMYPGKLAYPTGYVDSRYFTLWGFNTDSMKKRNLGRHDGLDLWEDGDGVISAKIASIQIFADGSTCIRFRHPVYIYLEQCATVAEQFRRVKNLIIGHPLE